MTRILTGIQPSGTLHIGNYFGMMKPSIELQNDKNNDCFYFIADLHSFTSNKNAKSFSKYQKDSVLDWIALGINPEVSTFYRQSDLAGIHTEMMWYLNCFMGMGALERAHSFKDKKAKGLDTNVGLFTYPVLMAADILLYDSEIIPVGKDQKQHVEMARDIAQKINHHFGQDFFTIPEPKIDEIVQTIPGIDGQKMSKSYGNTIPIFGTEKEIKKSIMSIQTETVNLGDPINPETCNIFAFHKLFENPNLKELEKKYKEGSIGFGESKKQLFELVWEYFSTAREKRAKLEKNSQIINKYLEIGTKKALKISRNKLQKIRKKMGLSKQSILQ